MEFINGLSSMGASVDRAEMQKVFLRIEGSGSDLAQALVSSVADAIADPMGFMTRQQARTLSPTPGKSTARASLDDARFKQLLEYISQVVRSRGLSALSFFNGLDQNRDGRLMRDEFLKGLTDLGVNGVERSELKKVF